MRALAALDGRAYVDASDACGRHRQGACICDQSRPTFHTEVNTVGNY